MVHGGGARFSLGHPGGPAGPRSTPSRVTADLLEVVENVAQPRNSVAGTAVPGIHPPMFGRMGLVSRAFQFRCKPNGGLLWNA